MSRKDNRDRVNTGQLEKVRKMSVFTIIQVFGALKLIKKLESQILIAAGKKYYSVSEIGAPCGS